MEADSLEKLVKSAQKGDRNSFSQLIQATEKDLYRFLVHLTKNPVLAQDLFQESYIKALENIKNLKDPSRFKSWLFRSAKNLFLDFVRSPKNKDYDRLEDKEIVSANTPEYEKVLQVQVALNKLKEDSKLAILLVDLEGYSYKEAADILDISENALRSRIHRAREEFLKVYEE